MEYIIIWMACNEEKHFQCIATGVSSTASGGMIVDIGARTHGEGVVSCLN